VLSSLLLLLLEYCPKSLLKRPFPDMDHEYTDENRTATQDMHPEQPLLKGIHLAQVDGIEAGLRTASMFEGSLGSWESTSVIAETTKNKLSV
jgi:hypothetical protein